MKWRKWNNILHRDIGYLTVGLTIIFAISGIAVNHIEDWNPNYKIEKEQFQIDPLTSSSKEQMVEEVIHKLGIAEEVESSFRRSPIELQIFFKNHTIQINTITGEGVHEYRQHGDYTSVTGRTLPGGRRAGLNAPPGPGAEGESN